MILFIVIALAVVALDRITKWLVIRHIPLGHEVSVIGQWGVFTHIKNTGAAFGLFPGSVVPLILVSVLASIIVVVMAERASRAGGSGQEGLGLEGHGQAGRLVPLGLILGGAIGNLIDRIAHGKVTDFILVGIPNGARFPVFNVADSAVTIGVTLLAVGIYFTGHAPAADPAPGADSASGSDSPDSVPRVNAVRAFGDTASHAPAPDPPSATPSETTADAVPGESR